ncbi:MAG: hypothetical protein AAFO29_20050 [Actinomycetota bacterium]
MWAMRYRILLLLAVATSIIGACSNSEPDLDTDSAAANLTVIVDSVAPLLDDGFADIDQCPLDPDASLLLRAIQDLDGDDVITAKRGEDSPGLFEVGPGLPLLITCDRFESTSGIGLVASTAPTDFDRYVEVLATGENENPGVMIDRRSSTDHRGGTLHRICVRVDAEQNELDYCEVDWVDDNLLITVYVAGPSALDTNLDGLEAGLIAVLDDVVTNLADADVDATSDS